MAGKKNRQIIILTAAALVILTIVIYWPVRTYEFINWDDGDYVYDNHNVQRGIDTKSLKWAFKTGHAANWHPLTWISHMTDYELYGMDPGFHHLSNLFLHALNTLLLFLVLRRITGAVWKSAFVAVLFALHPQHVESVAWISERKDVLSAFFGILTIYAYAVYAEKRSYKPYIVVFVLLALGLMAKPMLVTWPFILLLLDYWPLQRYNFRSANSMQKKVTRREKSSISELLIEKWPLFGLVIVSSVVTFIVQRASAAVSASEKLPLLYRIANAIVAYVEYLRQMLWPRDLAVLYPHPLENISIASIAFSFVILAAITYGVIRLNKRHRYLLMGWLWYLGTLVPVIGLVQVGTQAWADRYTYLPMIGIYIMIAWGVPEVLKKRSIQVAMAVGYIALMAFATKTQLRYWQNSTMLWEHTLSVTKDNIGAHINLGFAFKSANRFDEAIAQFEQALRLKPDHKISRYNIGSLLARQGKYDAAIEQARQLMQQQTDYHGAHLILGLVYTGKGQYKEAVQHCAKAIEVRSDYPEAYIAWGNALFAQNKLQEAILRYEKAIHLSPNYATAYANIGVCWHRLGDYSKAISFYQQTLRLDPDYRQARTNLQLAQSMLSKQQ